MKINTLQKIRIGIFTFVGVMLLVIGILVIGQNKNIFGGTYTLYGMFRNVGGLQVGNNVRFAGINVGTVEDISIVNDTTVKVSLRLQKNVKQFIKSDAVASIGSDGLMGDKMILVAPGSYSSASLAHGAFIRSVDPMDMDKVVARLSNVVTNVERISGDMASISGHIAAGKGSLGKLLYDDGLAESLEGTVHTANQTMKSIQTSSEGFGENMKAMKSNFLLKGYFKKKDREQQEKQKQR